MRYAKSWRDSTYPHACILQKWKYCPRINLIMGGIIKLCSIFEVYNHIFGSGGNPLLPTDKTSNCCNFFIINQRVGLPRCFYVFVLTCLMCYMLAFRAYLESNFLLNNHINLFILLKWSSRWFICPYTVAVHIDVIAFMGVAV